MFYISLFEEDKAFSIDFENGEQNYVIPRWIPFDPEIITPSDDELPPLIEDTSFSSHILQNKRRGRKRTKNNTLYQEHKPTKNDCKMAKIQTAYITFIIVFLNSIMKIFNLNYEFLQLDGKFKSNVNQKFRANLNKKTIKEILFNEPISKKYKKYDEFHNREIINKLKEEGQDAILNILDKNLLFFLDIFFESKKEFDLSSYGLGNLKVNLPMEIKLFDDLLKKTKYEDPVKYEFEMKRCIKKYFSFSNSDNSID
jgi:hypothetical protein